VVDAPVEVAVARAVARGPAGEDDVRARIAKQATREERVAKADFVIDNSGSLEDLRTQVAKAWRWIQDLR
jgi:dephospho-CoA kinase